MNVKDKGTRFEYEVLYQLQKIDPNARKQVMSGAVFGLEGDIRSKLPFTFELKHHEKIRLYEFWGQAVRQSSVRKPPVLIVKSNHKPTLVSMELQDWLELLAFALKANYPN